MNRKTIPILLAIVIALGLVALMTERPRTAQDSRAGSRAARIWDLKEAEIVQIRVKRDYWNSYTLTRGRDGAWKLTDPSEEPAAPGAVTKLVSALEVLPALSTINVPGDDSERYREYGLWKPSLELTVTTPQGDQTLFFGTETPDGSGVYCARAKRDGVFVTSAEVLRVLSEDYAQYREEKKPTTPPSQ